MHRAIIHILIIVFINTSGFCQETNVYTDQLLSFEEKIFSCSNDTLKNEILIQKFDFELQQNDLSLSCFNDCIRIKTAYISKKQELKRYLKNAALISYLNQQRDMTDAFCKSYETIDTTINIHIKLISVLNNFKYDTTNANQTLNVLTKIDSSFNCLECLCQVDSYHRKNLMFYIYSSAIIPGSGNIMQGKFWKGITSMGLTGITTLFAIDLWRNNLYINSVTLAGMLFMKFYLGNIRLTQVEFNQKETKQKAKLSNLCEIKIASLLDKYPLKFE